MKIKFNLRFIIVFLLVIFKYLKMQNFISNTISNCILLATLFIVLIWLGSRGKIKNINTNYFLILALIAVVQIVLLRDVDILILLMLGILFTEDKNYTRNIIKYFLISLVIVFITTIVLYQCGILESAYLSRIIDGIRIQRNSLGFAHPNETYCYFFMILLGFYYFSKNKKLFWFLALIVAYVLYKITLCRTGFLCIFVFLAIDVLYHSKIKINKYFFALGTVLTLLLGVFGANMNSPLNEALSYRPYYAHATMESGLIFNVLGNNLSKIQTNTNFNNIDNVYLHIILSSGLVFYVYYFWMYWKSGEKLEVDRRLTKIFIMTLIYGCCESHLINPGLNFVLAIQVCTLLIKEKPQEEIVEKQDIELCQE